MPGNRRSTRRRAISSSGADSTVAGPRLDLRRPDLGRCSVLLECRGNLHRPILALEVLQHCEQPAVGCRSAVERVHGLRPAVRAEANLQPARLEVSRIRAGGDLAVALLAREPRLDVVLPRRRRAEVARGDVDDAIRQADRLDELLLDCEEPLVLAPGLLGPAVDEHLDLVELVDAKHPTRVLPRRTGLAAKAG